MITRVLLLGKSGNDVAEWQAFLRGTGIVDIRITGIFDDKTKAATQKFQRELRSGVTLKDDGIVGPKTLSVAMAEGFGHLDGGWDGETSPDWPPVSSNTPSPVAANKRNALFGTITYKAIGTKSNPEAIQITNKWCENNIVVVDTPFLKDVSGHPNTLKVEVNKAVADSFLALWKAWEDAGLLNRVVTWDGMWAPRFIRGSRTTLSNHAWATAFDINAQWNFLGRRPALVGEVGSVRELVGIAEEHGWYWGGRFQNRFDGMHFEATESAISKSKDEETADSAES